MFLAAISASCNEVKRMKRIGLLCSGVLLAFASLAMTLNDSIDEIVGHIKNGNSKELSGFFSSTVSITLLNDDGVYSKVQAEIILKEFFNRYQPKEVSQIQKVDNNPNHRYVAFQLKTEDRTFRVTIKLISDNDSFKITELSIV